MVKNSVKTICCVVVVACLGACGAAEERLPTGFLALGLVDGTPEAVALLHLLNHAETDRALLVDEAGISAEAAVTLLAWRNGPDQVGGTADDQGFESIRAVDALLPISAEDAAALLDLAAARFALGLMDPLGDFDGIPFTVGQAELTLILANQAAASFLQAELAWEGALVDRLLAARPLVAVSELAALPGMSPTLLLAARDQAWDLVD